jgi:prevent-host-death family protein
MGRSLPLSEAKARLSEVVRTVRSTGEETVITVDGEPAVRVVPALRGPATLTEAETATAAALMKSIRRIRRRNGTFDALDLIRDGRR